MRVGVLGATEVVGADDRVVPMNLKPRQVVATLTLAGGRPVSLDAIVDMLWGDEPPEGLPGTLHAYIARLRTQLEPDRAPRVRAQVLVTAGSGYALHVPEDAVDAVRFQRVVTDVNRRLDQPDALSAPRLAQDALLLADSDLQAALALWRGPAYADLGDRDAVRQERARLDELRLVALEDHLTIALALGRQATAAAELEALAAAHPTRERLWLLRALALYASGRQGDALAALREHARLLDDELGVEPSPEARELEVRMLRQDPQLAWQAKHLAGTPTATATPHVAARVDGPLALPAWPLAGRDAELAELEEALRAATAGTPSFVAVTGEPGIGKTRLCTELAARAVRRGARLLVGRCSQDEGAPPLWPWRQVLQGLGHDLDVDPEEDQGAAFRTWDTVVRQVRDAARSELIVVVLDDLQWADVPTLRVLRHLVETVARGRVLVLATWRAAAVGDALADVAEAIARAHGVRLDLAGLDETAVAEVVSAVCERPAAPDEVEALARRTDGNPFYLVEFARLARDDGLTSLLGSSTTPSTVSDVVTRRIQRLPAPVVTTLRAASVVGRTFDLAATLAAARTGGGDTTEDAVLDHLDAARAAGLVREDDVDVWSFSHALVREAVYDGLGASRAARAHARVAEALEAVTGRETEAARHWLAAGPGHAHRAWRALERAAEVARHLHAHDEAAALLDQAVGAARSDAGLEERQLFELLMLRGEAEWSSGRWTALEQSAEEALDLAERLGDVELRIRAASALTAGAFWQTTRYGEVHHRQVAALRECLEELSGTDSPLRCRAMIALSAELYYESSAQERAALADEAIAMARRLGDGSLLVDALLAAFISAQRPSTAPQREAWAREATEVSLVLGDGARFVSSSTLHTVVLGELGRVAEMWETEAGARAEAERLRLTYGVVVLDSLVVGWLAMAGRAEEAVEARRRLEDASTRVTLRQMDEALLGATLAVAVWQGDPSALVPYLVSAEPSSPLPLDALVCQALVRSGQVEEARRRLADRPLELLEESWFSKLHAAAAAETAAHVGDRDLGSRCYEWLVPLTGQSTQAGSGAVEGPVDAYVALAAHAAGEFALATRHADEAATLMERWDLPVAAAWFDRVRRRLGF
ncbi:AAA family ATPase [Nocardioides KLBMP 9356]|uniref:AAA family ATPase n=1 Tax=Nocardioides potassii TaxID=2911371 RepID=A0ABS9HB61_9ACTN|nr:BTAD domain-containing putative transcriptional regulator [Nocardioides potassii]MCF6378415.1 AAA family ATPase [Nocardioides potassii]